ncbi:MAG TPA: glutamate-1-semialdehyde 2,1-aminomutase [Polyangiaceae bacterium]|nr:glutamate-1-semialdehyde 2,1-aminomutase [Polyangiaceae bacterium]
MSDSMWSRAQRVLVGGVNSPVRAYRAVGGDPPFIQRASGARVFDTEGREYVDYVGSWGPAILGHAQPDVVAAVQQAAASGLSFGAPTHGEVLLGEELTKLYPSIEVVRLVSSGTEATMSALRLARGFTGRDLIVKFDGCYHGHSDGLLVQAGSGAATFGSPDSAGVPSDIAKNTLSARFNDLPGLERLFARHGAQIAAVIVEPVVGNMGCVPPSPGFLAGLLALCQRHGALSIFDEVMTGCRLSRSGAQGLYGLTPDLTCLGKIVGGGMPLAAYGGRREIMEKLAPLGPVYQAGTLSGNPLAVAAARATIARLDEALYQKLELLGARLEAGLNSALAETRIVGTVQRVGSMITLFFREGPVLDWDTAQTSDKARFAAFHRGLRERGIYWPPSQYEAAFLSGTHDEADIDRTVAAAREALRAL